MRTFRGGWLVLAVMTLAGCGSASTATTPSTRGLPAQTTTTASLPNPVRERLDEFAAAWHDVLAGEKDQGAWARTDWELDAARGTVEPQGDGTIAVGMRVRTSGRYAGRSMRLVLSDTAPSELRSVQVDIQPGNDDTLLIPLLRMLTRVTAQHAPAISITDLDNTFEACKSAEAVVGRWHYSRFDDNGISQLHARVCV